MARPRKSEPRRKCYCDLHVTPGKRIPIARWIQHQDRQRAQALLVHLTEQSPEPETFENETDVGSDHSENYVCSISDEDVGDVIGHLEDEMVGQAATAVDDYEYELSFGHAREFPNLDLAIAENHVEDNEEEDEETGSTEIHDTLSYSQVALEDVSNWTLHDIRFEKAIPWLLWKIEHNVSDVAFNNRPNRSFDELSLLQVKTRLQQLIRFKSRRIPCCLNVCLLFYNDDPEVCPICNEPTKETVTIRGKRVVRPRKHYFYLSPIDRLLLMFAHSSTSQDIQEYVAIIRDPSRNPSIGSIRNFYDSTTFRHLSHLFEDHRTVPMFISTDGYTTTRQANGSFWQQILTVGNKPPEVRYRELLLFGLIPGEPADLGSFFRPFLDDVARLERGIEAYDGWRKERFILKGVLCGITGDGPAISKMMALKGANGVSPCRYCRLTGQYCTAKQHYYFPLANLEVLPLRENMRQEVIHVAAANDPNLRKAHGINGISMFFGVNSIRFPEGFGLDLMHLIANVGRMFWEIWTGSILPEQVFAVDEESPQPYILSKVHQALIGSEMFAASKSIPTTVSRTPRNIEKHKSSFKATEWFDFVLIYSVPLLSYRLLSYALQSWRLFVEATQLAVQVQLTDTEVTRMDTLFWQFVRSTEAIYHQGMNDRLACCTVQLHYLLHVAQNIKNLGPSYVSWQYSMERYIGSLNILTTSKSSMDVSLYNNLDLKEQMNYTKMLYNLSTTRRQSNTAANTIDVVSDGMTIGQFSGSAGNVSLDDSRHCCLARYYNAPPGDVDRNYLEWHLYRRDVATGTAQTFTISSGSRRHTDRDRNHVLYMTNNNGDAKIGRVLSFMEHVHNSCAGALVLLRPLITAEDVFGNCRILREAASCVVVPAYAVVESVGLLGRKRLRNSVAAATAAIDNLEYVVVRGYRVLEV